LKDLNDQRLRVNFQIRIPNIRVVHEGKQLGIMPTEKARNMAMDLGLDLVEMVANANPPVCHIMDYSKYKYEQKIKLKENAKKQKELVQETKELRFNPSIDNHDLQIKCKHIREFIEHGKKVQIVMKFRTREFINKDVGLTKFNQIIEYCKDIAEAEYGPKFEGNKFICRVTPLKRTLKPEQNQ
jgi:translation initiation factor IF-3